MMDGYEVVVGCVVIVAAIWLKSERLMTREERGGRRVSREGRGEGVKAGECARA
jgi:hypothetical protein